MNQWIALSLAMAAVCAVVLAITIWRQRRIGEDDDPNETPDVIEYMTMMIGVIYAIVLGLAIAGVWEARNSAQANTLAEAQALHEITTRAQVYEPAALDRIRTDVTAYADYVVDTEWRTMLRTGQLTDHGDQLLATLRTDLTAYQPRNDHDMQSYQPLIDQAAAVDTARTTRGASAGATMPAVVWFGLITGAIVAIGLVFTLQIRRTPANSSSPASTAPSSPSSSS